MSTSGNIGASGPEVNFTQQIDDGPFGKQQVIVIGVLGSLVLLDGMDTQILGVIAHDMTRDLGLPISVFGILFSAGLFGAVVGALLLSPVADRLLGKKTVLILSMTLASLATIATPLADDLYQLLFIRFVAGLGLGAALPSIFTLASEFVPKRYSRRVTSILIAFMPLGSLLAGMIGTAVVPGFGWPMLLYAGGSLTLALTALAIFVVPESVYFLSRVKGQSKRAIQVAQRLLPGQPIGSLIVESEEDAGGKKQPVIKLFSSSLWKYTTLLWLAFIMNQGILYFILSWTPALLQNSGQASSAGMHAASLFGIGGALGTIAQGWLATRFNIYKVMIAEMALYFAGVLLLPFVISDAVLAPAAVFFVAAGICAYHAGFIFILVETYPIDIRTTGFGWAFGIGRIGATGAPVLAGFLVGLGWTSGEIFVAASVPGIVSLLALVTIALLLVHRNAANQTLKNLTRLGER